MNPQGNARSAISDRPQSTILVLMIFVLLAACVPAHQAALAQSNMPVEPQVIPTRYVGHLFYATPVTVRGDTLVFLIDSGGGTSLRQNVVRRYNLPRFFTGYYIAGDSVFRAPLPLFREGASIPPPLTNVGRLFVINPYKVMPGDVARETGIGLWSGGQLGYDWHAGRTWTYDYENRQFLVWAPMAPLPEAGHRIRLRFKKDERGRRVGRIPVLDVVVAGDTLAMTFDTGAAVSLTPRAEEILGLQPLPEHATSYIRASVFERWQREHPDWQVIENATKT